MATQTQHWVFNPGTASGSRFRTGLDNLERGRVFLINEHATMKATLLQPADGTDPAQFAQVVIQYGFASADEAQAAFQLLEQALNLITSDAPVDEVGSTLTALFTQLR